MADAPTTNGQGLATDPLDPSTVAADAAAVISGSTGPIVGTSAPIPIVTTPAKKGKNNKTATEESPNLNKHNFFYVVCRMLCVHAQLLFT